MTNTMTDEVVWDGVARGYIPPEVLRVSDRVKLHTETAERIDPITFEVVRNALLNANFEHGYLLQKLCVSPITVSSRDFQPSIMLEDGDLVFLGPNVQYFSSCQSLATKWILENRGENPGINEGDIFLSNDSYVGSPHQLDTMVAAPVFVEDRIFCWVSNALHYSDLGGAVPGSMVVDAQDVFDESLPIPPIKIVENGVLRRDIEELFVRQSRTPVNVRMDLRASLSGVETARGFVLGLVEKYGAPVVKGIMRRILDSTESKFEERLQLIPDGEWSARSYTEAAVTGDRSIYRYQLNLRKKDGRLIFDNEGTDPQAGAINIAYAGLAGAIQAAVASSLMPDASGAYGGVYRRVDINPVPGTLSCADYPGAVSPAGAFTMELVLALASTVVARMMASGTDQIHNLLLGPSIPTFATAFWGGVNDKGVFYVGMDSDAMMGALSASPGRDGVDVGGHFWIPDGIAPNVEQNERSNPVLYLYRRLLEQSESGAGRWRGGLGFVSAAVPWRSGPTQMVLYTNESFAKQQGLSGANPMGKASFRWRSGVGIEDSFQEGVVPGSLDSLGGHENVAQFKGAPLAIGPGDAWEKLSGTAAGYGDPMLRDIDAVLEDFQQLRITPDAAKRIYGVVINDGQLDVEATKSTRSDLLSARRNEGVAPRVTLPLHVKFLEEGRRSIGDVLELRRSIDQTSWFACGMCEAPIAPASQNFKDGCRFLERTLASVSEEYVSLDREMADRVVFREFCCSSCGVRIETEIAKAEDPWLNDFRLLTT